MTGYALSVKRLGELTTLISSGSTPRGGSEVYLEHGPVMLIRSQNVRMNHLMLDDVAYIDDATASQMLRSHVAAGDVLLNITGASIGRVACVTDVRVAATVNQHVCIIRPRPELLSAPYLAYLISSPRFQGTIDRLQHGGTRQALTFSQIADFEIPLPPLPEQRRIAAILDKADELRAARRRALAQLDTLTQSIFLEMFGDPDGNTTANEYDAFGGYIEFITTGGRGWAKYYTDQGDRFIRSLDVQMNHIGNGEVVFVNAPDNGEARRTRVRAGDILLTMTGSRIGRVATAPPALDGAYISQHVAIIRLTNGALNPDFVSFYLSMPNGGQRQISRFQYGQTKPGLNLEQVRAFKIPVPPPRRQREFVARRSEVENLRTGQERCLQYLDRLFASLQHRAFRGEL